MCLPFMRHVGKGSDFSEVYVTQWPRWHRKWWCSEDSWNGLWHLNSAEKPWWSLVTWPVFPRSGNGLQAEIDSSLYHSLISPGSALKLSLDASIYAESGV